MKAYEPSELPENFTQSLIIIGPSTKLAASKTSIVIGRNDPPSLTPLQSVAYSSFPGQGGQTHFLPGFSISSR